MNDTSFVEHTRVQEVASKSPKFSSVPPMRVFHVPGESEDDSWTARTRRAARAVAWEWDLETGHVDCSAELYDLLGVQPGTDDLLGVWNARIHPDDQDRLKAEVRRFFLEEESDEFDLALRLARPDGVRWLNLRGAAIRDAAGRRVRVSGLTLDITERHRLERDAIHLSAFEQRRVGYELHDELCQQLAGIHIKTQVLLERLEQEASAHVDYLSRIIEMVDRTRIYTRNLSRTLTPILVENSQLKDALRQLIADTSAMHDVDATFEVLGGPLRGKDVGVATQLYRIAEEALRWSARHRRAHTVHVELISEGHGGRLVVRDDGVRDLDDDTDADNVSAVRIMQMRADAVGAEIELEHLDGGGAQLVCRFAGL